MPAVDLQRRGGDAPAGVGGVRLGHRGGERRRTPARGRAPSRRSRSSSARPRPRAASARSGAIRPGRRRSGGRTACGPWRRPTAISIARWATPGRLGGQRGDHRGADQLRGPRPGGQRLRRKPRRSVTVKSLRVGSIPFAGVIAQALGAGLDDAERIAVEHDHEVGAGRVGHGDLDSGEAIVVRLQRGLERMVAVLVELGERAAQLAGRQAAPASAHVLVVSRRLQRQRRARVRQQRRGRERVAQLLLDDDQLDQPQPLAAPALVHDQAGPAELHELRPLLVGEAAARPRPSAGPRPRDSAWPASRAPTP